MKHTLITLLLSVLILNAAEEAAAARFCAAEAAGEPLICRVGVAAALINRLEDDRYPDTFSGVLAGAGFRGGRVRPEAYEEALRAVRMAEMGLDPTHGGTAWARRGTAREAEIRDVRLAAGGMVFGGD